ncbi:MAG: SpoIIE family protein phosphatase [bacterium]|nr:MAG: SpoIIE family protein phosphatase [bacterium]
MHDPLTEEVQKVLNHFKKLFDYKSVYLFPDIQDQIISPILLIDAEIKEPFKHQKKISWLNYYQDVLTEDNIDDHLSISDFLKYYKINILFPIRQNGNCFGFLGINNNARKIKEIELQIGQFIVSYLASFWRNLELLKENREASEKTQAFFEEISSLLEISHALESGEDIQKLLESIIQTCMSIMNAESASLMLLDEEKNELEFKVALGPKGKEVKPLRLPIGKGIAGWVAKESKPLLIPNAYEDERFDRSFDRRTGYVTRSILCVPLIYNKKTVGVLQALNRKDGKSFSQENLHAFTLFATLAALAIENSRLIHRTIEKEKFEKDLVVATEIQRLIIPHHLPKVRSLELSGIYIPSRGIGGDFYSVFPVNEDQTVFCIADVTGKGVTGALLVSTLHATIKAYLDFTSDLILILQKLNHLIEELSTSDRYITLFIASYDQKTSELTYVNAGHNPPLLFSKEKTPVKLTEGGVCLGVLPYEYTYAKITLEPNNILLMYTDGVVEAMNDQNVMFGEKNLIQTVLDKRNQSCEVIQDEITLRVLDHCADQPLNDDYTLFILRRK